MDHSTLQDIHSSLRTLLEDSDPDAVLEESSIFVADGTEAGPRLKPSPDLVLAACAHFDVPPSRTVLVGDALTDVAAAAAAGCWGSALVTSSFHGRRAGARYRAAVQEGAADAGPAYTDAGRSASRALQSHLDELARAAVLNAPPIVVGDEEDPAGEPEPPPEVLKRRERRGGEVQNLGELRIYPGAFEAVEGLLSDMAS